MTETRTIGCVYELTEQGIHKFTFTGKGEKGLDEFFELVKPVLQDSGPEMTLRYIVDTTQGKGKVSMVELAKRFRKLEIEVGPRGKGRTAIIHSRNIFLSMANMFISNFAPNQDQTKFFKDDELDEATAWVLSDD